MIVLKKGNQKYHKIVLSFLEIQIFGIAKRLYLDVNRNILAPFRTIFPNQTL